MSDSACTHNIHQRTLGCYMCVQAELKTLREATVPLIQRVFEYGESVDCDDLLDLKAALESNRVD
jgi:hypothetical protein